MIPRSRLLVRARCACGVVVIEAEEDPDNPGMVRYRRRMTRRRFWAVSLHTEATCPEHGSRDTTPVAAAVDRARATGRVVTVKLGPHATIP